MTDPEELEETLKTAAGEERIPPLLDYAYALHLKDPDKDDGTGGRGPGAFLEALLQKRDLSLSPAEGIYWGMKGKL